MRVLFPSTCARTLQEALHDGPAPHAAQTTLSSVPLIRWWGPTGTGACGAAGAGSSCSRPTCRDQCAARHSCAACAWSVRHRGVQDEDEYRRATRIVRCFLRAACWHGLASLHSVCAGGTSTCTDPSRALHRSSTASTARCSPTLHMCEHIQPCTCPVHTHTRHSQVSAPVRTLISASHDRCDCPTSTRVSSLTQARSPTARCIRQSGAGSQRLGSALCYPSAMPSMKPS